MTIVVNQPLAKYFRQTISPDKLKSSSEGPLLEELWRAFLTYILSRMSTMVFPVPCMMYWIAMAATITAKTLVTIIDPRSPSNLFIESAILRIKMVRPTTIAIDRIEINRPFD